MLTSTFIHVQGIGYTTERKLWDMGAHDWESYLELHQNIPLAEGKKSLILPCVEESVERLAERDYAYFARVIPPKDHWRAFGEFGGDIAYLDIETTGCNGYDDITVIGLFDGCEMHSFVKGVNLEEFPKVVGKYKMLATFFGTGFDLPFIKRTFPKLKLDQLHIDLCFLLRRLGFKGGLKKIEGQFGINRRPEVDGMDGLDAVRLWHEYRRGSREALDLLLTYNKEDVMNMETLLAYGCKTLENSLNHPRCTTLT